MLEQIMSTILATFAAFVLARIGEYFLKERRERRRQKEDLAEFKLLVLKCVITNRELSRQARLDAYDKYKRLGGNSWVDGYVFQYLKVVED